MPERVGQQFGNYRLVRLLGHGGFAEVYLGQHVRLSSQKAALKILSTRLNEEDVQAFEREAETIAQLVHPHIVRILDFDITDGIPFLVMDYAPNGSLRQRHRLGEQVALSTALSYIQQVAEGLQYAHDQKLIHRDIKPDNMLVGARNEIVLSDFGIATIAHSTTSQSAQAAIGTIPYMAPEQMQEYPRPASDQYALAITLYEWLTGERPFSGSFTEIAVKHAMVPPPPLREKRPDLSREIEQVILTALAKDPKARFESVQAFANALQEAMRMSPSTHSSVSQAEVVTQTRAASQPASPLPPASAHPVPAYGPHSYGITIDNQASGSVNCIAWSPDGKQIVAACEDGSVHILSAIDGKRILVYQGHQDSVDYHVNSVAWSPDGLLIASAADDKTVQVWYAMTGQAFSTYRKHAARIWSVAWAPSGPGIASASSDGTVQIWHAGTGRRILKYAQHSGPVYSAVWSPDSRWIASASNDYAAQVWSTVNGACTLVYRGHHNSVTNLAWSPDGRWIASASEDHTVQIWSALNGTRAFVYQGHAGFIESITWSPNGQWIASASDDCTVQVWNPVNGKRAFAYHAHHSMVNSVAWSPTGRQIASASADGLIHIWQMP